MREREEKKIELIQVNAEELQIVRKQMLFYAALRKDCSKWPKTDEKRHARMTKLTS